MILKPPQLERLYSPKDHYLLTEYTAVDKISSRFSRIFLSQNIEALSLYVPLSKGFDNKDFKKKVC